jgi:hypothetical protein
MGWEEETTASEHHYQSLEELNKLDFTPMSEEEKRVFEANHRPAPSFSQQEFEVNKLQNEHYELKGRLSDALEELNNKTKKVQRLNSSKKKPRKHYQSITPIK